MVGRAAHDFPQEAPAAPFKTVLLSDLEHALVTKRLHNLIPAAAPRRRKARSGWFGDGPFVWVQRPRHPLIQQAKQWAAVQIRSDLHTGVLTAFMPTKTPGIFLRIKPQFWSERRSGIRVDGMLFDLDKCVLVPDEIDESTFCAFEECARSWLARREIDENNPAFPDALRIDGPARTGPKPLSMKPQRTKQEIIDKMREMKNEDGLSRDDITKTICEKSGFEGVTNVKARSLYKYVAERGRPRKGN